MRDQFIKDFYAPNADYTKTCKKHCIPVSYGRKLAKEIIAEKFQPKDYLVIKVESKWMANALDQLDRAGIKYEVPEKFELTEIYQSKINK